MIIGHFPRALVAALLIVAAREVSAQEPLAGPADPVPPVKPPAVVQRFDFGLAVYQGFDRTLANDTRPTPLTDSRFREDTSLSSASGTLAYSRHSRDVDFSLLGGGNVRYFTVVPDLIPMDAFSGSSVSSKLTRRTRVHASGFVSYSPYYSFGSFLQPRHDTTALLAPTTEQNIARLATLSYDASAGLTWSLTPKTSLDVDYSGNVVDTDAFTYRSVSQGVNTRMSHRTSRYSTFRAGYGYREVELGGLSRRLRIHDINVGFGYQRPLSFSRHTVVGFNVGSSVVEDPLSRTFIVTGDASLAHQLTRRWSTSAYYHRDVDAFAGAVNLFVTDSVSGALTGAFTRKLAFSVNGGYSLGRVATGITNGYHATSGGSRFSYLASRYVPLFVEYVFYHYEFDQGIGLASGFPLLTTRHGLRAGLSYNVPLIGRRTR